MNADQQQDRGSWTPGRGQRPPFHFLTPGRKAVAAIFGDWPARRRRSWFLVSAEVTAGVVLPLVALLTELIGGPCGDLFFDPVPTLWHAALILVLAISNAAVCWCLVTQRIVAPRLLASANAIALSVAAFYALIFLPLMPLALVGIVTVVLFPFALLALAPAIAFALTLGLRHSLRAAVRNQFPRMQWPRLGWGVLIAALALIIPDAQITATRAGMHWAASHDAAVRERGVRLLRSVGDERTMLRACAGRGGRSIDLLGFLFTMADPISGDEARQVYYRVTGEAFEAQPAARSNKFRVVDLDFDERQGGVVSGPLLPGLSLSESRIDGSLDPAAALAYLEWTMVFSNDRGQQAEARSEIQLPPGAVVSRVTLWINGEEREAAFGGKSQVREAYQRVVQARRDPLLVTASGKDRVLAQCFPVLPQGQMKMRLGITTPLELEHDAAVMALPHFVERNFSSREARHEIWLEAHAPLSTTQAAWRTERTPDGAYALRASIGDAALEDPAQVVVMQREPQSGAAWTPDPKSPQTRAITQQVVWSERPALRHVVIAVDGSKSMNEFLPSIAEALQAAPMNLTYEIVRAADLVEFLGADAPRLRQKSGSGGADNAPALERAYDIATRKGAPILWIHGSQPVLLESSAGIENNWRRRASSLLLYSLQVTPGPNQLAAALEDLPQWRSLHRRRALKDDLARVLSEWSTGSPEGRLVREPTEFSGEAPAEWGARTSDHLARLWAAGETVQLNNSRLPGDRENAAVLATGYQLVTAVSGAVVLESQAQYDQANLTPADARSVPTVPEPEEWALIAVALALLGGRWLIGRRQCRLA